MEQHYFQHITCVGTYEFSWDKISKILYLTYWPNGVLSMRIIAAGLLITIEDAKIAATRYISYIETSSNHC